MDYSKLAEEFFYKSYQLKKNAHQQMIDESLQGEMFTLLYLKDQKGFVLPGEISTKMNISTARVANILNTLENKDFIIREIDKIDRRRILVSLTQQGEEKAEEHSKMIITQIAKMLEILGEEDAKSFVRITSKLIDISPTFIKNE